jgi:hypothetical protein
VFASALLFVPSGHAAFDHVTPFEFAPSSAGARQVRAAHVVALEVRPPERTLH